MDAGVEHHKVLNTNIFSKGREVEVGSEEAGLRNSWYSATIINSPTYSPSSSEPNTVTSSDKEKTAEVKYHSLYADELGSSPLIERVKLSLLRPSTPPPAPTLPSFELNHLVDAYYRDGWWTGVISQILGDSRFVVTFKDPPDVGEFKMSELRFHREWKNGEWSPPLKQRTTGMIFSTGKKVEVCFENENCRDVWFPATVIENTGNDSFLVKYEISRTGEEDEAKESARLYEETMVDSLHIRPSPPNLNYKNFVVLDEVDAFYDFGWWSGVITKQVPTTKYLVLFKHTNKEMELNHSELRPHMEWRDGKWFSSSRRKICMTEDEVSGIMSLRNFFSAWNKDGSADLNQGTDAKRPRSRLSRKTRAGNAAAETLSLISYELNTPVKTCATNDKKNSSEQMAVDQSTTKPNNLSNTEVVDGSANHDQGTNAKKPRLRLSIKRAGNAAAETLSLLANELNSPVKTGATSDKINSSEKMAVDQSATIPASLSNEDIADGSANYNQGTDAKKPCLRLSIKKAGNAAAETLSLLANELNSPVKTGATNDKINSSEKMAVDQSATKPDSLSNEDVVGSDQVGDGGNSNQAKKRRGRPPKLLPVRKLTRVVGDVEMMVVKDEIGTPANGHIKKKLLGCGSATMPETPLTEIGSQNVCTEEATATEGSKKEWMDKTNVKETTGSQNVCAEATEGDNKAGWINWPEKSTTGESPSSTSNMSDDLPLSTWLVRDHPQTTIIGDSNVAVSKKKNAQESSEGGAKVQKLSFPVVVSYEEAAAVVTPLPSETGRLPFVKNPALWGAIESMDLFKRMPQNPHFRGLESCNEIYREGLAVASMVNFSTVVENTNRLLLDDPISKFESNLKTLEELEAHGFDVKRVRDRLKELLVLKNRNEELQRRYKHAESDITEHNRELTEFVKKNAVIVKQLRELEETHALLMINKEKNDSEIASLESKIQGINDAMSNIRNEFVQALGPVFHQCT